MSSLKDILTKNLGTATLTIVLTLSLGLNVYLASHATFPKERPTPLKADAKVPESIAMEDADGNPVNINFADDTRPTVLYVLSPLCGWCKRNEANMKALYSADSARYRFISVSIKPRNLKQYVADGHEPFPVYLLKSKDIAKQLHVIGTPETIVVSPSARVVHAWEGVYTKSNQAEVEKYFGLKLPGLPETAQLEKH